MSEKLKINSVAFLITQKCSLNCKHCAALVPQYKDKQHVPAEIVRKEIEQIFKIYEYIEFLDISGGEALLHPQLSEILEFALNYEQHISNLRITTNGTVVLNEDTIKILSKSPKATIKIDRYGANSFSVNELEKQCIDNKINYRIVSYDADNQYCGGWVDYGEFEYQNYNDEQLNKIFASCHPAHWGCIGIRFGKVHLCSMALAGAELGKYKPKTGEYIDLFETNFSPEKAISIAERFGTVPIEACKYCRGFDPKNSPRVPAGEQICKSFGNMEQ